MISKGKSLSEPYSIRGLSKEKRRGVDPKLSFTIFLFNAMIKKEKGGLFYGVKSSFRNKKKYSTISK